MHHHSCMTNTRIHVQRIAASFGIASTLALGAWAGQAIAHAEPSHVAHHVWVDPITGQAWLSPEDCPSSKCYYADTIVLSDASA